MKLMYETWFYWFMVIFIYSFLASLIVVEDIHPALVFFPAFASTLLLTFIGTLELADY